ncbi:MAG: hypothetical protein MUF06_18860, partial [Pirellulaceae bacterium]|nr:hypothetical protein [Pirellulaceae bacterium]
VFGVGDQDGLLYYVMQFIHGQGLDHVLVELRRLRQSGAWKLLADAATHCPKEASDTHDPRHEHKRVK